MQCTVCIIHIHTYAHCTTTLYIFKYTLLHIYHVYFASCILHNTCVVMYSYCTVHTVLQITLHRYCFVTCKRKSQMKSSVERYQPQPSRKHRSWASRQVFGVYVLIEGLTFSVTKIVRRPYP